MRVSRCHHRHMVSISANGSARRTERDKLARAQDKIRIILNKVQQIDTQQLLRVYGALMWSLGEVLRTPEVPRVYMGSFWYRLA